MKRGWSCNKCGKFTPLNKFYKHGGLCDECFFIKHFKKRVSLETIKEGE